MYRKSTERQSFSGRRILPAAQDPQTTTVQAGNDVDSVLGKPKAQLPRRTVTAVACNLCKARKSKCDGERPVCRACCRRGQPSECQYDANSDQRRTAALKDRIAELRGLTDDLKLIITTLVRDREQHSSLHEICEELIRSDFVDVQRVAQILQNDPTLAQLAQQEQSPLANAGSYPPLDDLSPGLEPWSAMSSAHYTTSHPAYATAAGPSYYQAHMASVGQNTDSSSVDDVAVAHEQQQQQHQYQQRQEPQQQEQQQQHPPLPPPPPWYAQMSGHWPT